MANTFLRKVMQYLRIWKKIIITKLKKYYLAGLILSTVTGQLSNTTSISSLI
jgi:hypothetical protein